MRIDEDELSQPWLCEETGLFSHRICNFVLPKRIRMPRNVKTYDETRDPKDHLKNFKTGAKLERWVMPTWCLMFNSTLMGAARLWIDELPLEIINSFVELQKAFLTYSLQQKKLNENIPKSVDEMMSVTTSFLRGEVVVSNQSKRKRMYLGNTMKVQASQAMLRSQTLRVVKDQEGDMI
ncbi:hypothetical protein Tco_1388324, partial [Tanacetum coccineum]